MPGEKRSGADVTCDGKDLPPPPRGNPHRHFFRRYAPDRKPDLSSGATKDQVMKAVEGHVLGRGEP
jgi:hypothetical protein